MSEGKYWLDEMICNNAGLENGDVWVTGDGNRISIKNLTDEHLINIVKKIKSTFSEDEFTQYDNLVDELKVRKIDLSKYPKKELKPLRGKERDFGSMDVNDYDVTEGFSKNDVASAFRFYKRYMHNSSLLKKEMPELAELSKHLKYEIEYNRWLLDYCFGDVAYGGEIE